MIVLYTLLALEYPEGVGGKIAIEKALVSSGIKPSDVDYINLHGTNLLYVQ
jgi:3-oxoacyl-[acyl-carrier-protein] synthase-1